MIRTRVGYAGGKKLDPTYHDLGDHTESIQVVYDPEKISYGTLLSVFWDAHDPTNEPWSVQYRSAIFPTTDEQLALAEASKRAKAAALGEEIHTAIEAGARFWTAEDYHQKYRLRGEPVVMKALAERYPDGGWVDSTAAARINGILGGHGYVGEISDLGLPREAEAVLTWRTGRSEGRTLSEMLRDIR